MSPAEPAPPNRRSASRGVMHCVRRLHLYLGLFLFPWAVLYGVTAFLFNHPAAFSDQPSTPFGRDALADTPMHSPPSPADAAGQLVAELNRRTPGASYRLAGDAHYARDFASATAKTPAGETVSIQIAVNGQGGTVRAQPPRPRATPKTPAPFAVGARPGPARGPRGGGKMAARPVGGEGLKLDDALPERVKASLPAVLDRLGIEAGEVAVTAVPDLTFRMTDADGVGWNVTHNALTGTVAGTRADEEAATGLSIRRFLLRLHTAHGYPSSVGARWFWALVVDAMAFVMVFWAVSGLFMWWQLKATRRWGVLCLLLSAAAATGLTVAMYRLLTS